MARSHRKHLPPGKVAKRGGRTQSEDRNAPHKSQKQQRANQRSALRREFS